jgi:hypothetical protein
MALIIFTGESTEMRTRRYQFVFAVAVLLLLVIGCSSQSQETPPPDTMSVSVIATPTEAPALPPPPDFTPRPGYGIVQGVLSLEGQPAPERVLYLAAIIHTGEDIEIAALDPVNDPRVESDQAGQFAFLDLPPGRYALGINSPAGPILIRGGDGDEIVAEVQADQVVDLGTVVIVPFDQ